MEEIKKFRGMAMVPGCPGHGVPSSIGMADSLIDLLVLSCPCVDVGMWTKMSPEVEHPWRVPSDSPLEGAKFLP